MNKCLNCRHWQYKSGAYGTCQKISDAVDWQNRDPAVIYAWAADDTNLGSKLLTHPDFGCVSFEARPPKGEGDDCDE